MLLRFALCCSIPYCTYLFLSSLVLCDSIWSLALILQLLSSSVLFLCYSLTLKVSSYYASTTPLPASPMPCIHTYIHTYTQAQTDIRTDRQTYAQADRQADRQTDIRTHTPSSFHSPTPSHPVLSPSLPLPLPLHIPTDP